jgi:hypothetical protein
VLFEEKVMLVKKLILKKLKVILDKKLKFILMKLLELDFDEQKK